MAGPYYATYTEQNTTNLVTGGDSEVSNIFGSLFNTSVTNTDNEVRLKPKTTVIDIVNDFAWTISPTAQSKLKIPTLYATELRQMQNSLVSSALYYLNTLSTNSADVADNVVDYLTAKLGDKGAVGSAVSGAGNSVLSALKKFKSSVNSLVTKGVDSSILTTYLKSYIGMYLTETTGFKYAFPFYTTNPHSVKNSWQDSMQVKPFLVSGVVNTGMEFIDTAAATLNTMQPGTYIEKPKYFHYPTEGESITMRIPLINTFKKNNRLPYQQNYELLWILAFQNKPYRTSFSRILPPKLYTVSVPGMKYFPYAYISSMNVDFEGTTRLLPVETPLGAVTTTIPEAYVLTITFTSLIADTGNLMASNGFRALVDVRTRSS